MASGDSILRKRQRSRYATIDNEVLQDTRLSLRAVGLAAYLLSLPDDWNINLAGIVRGEGREGRDAVRAALRELAEYGYMMRTRETGGYGKARTVTMLADFPAFVDVGTVASRLNGYEFRPTGNQEVEFQPTENTSVDFSVAHTKDLSTNDVLGGEGVGDGSAAVDVPAEVFELPELPALSADPAPQPEPAPPSPAWVAGADLSDLQRQAADLFRSAGIRSANQLAATRIQSADDVVWAGRMVAEYLAEDVRRPEWLHGRIMRNEQPTGEAERERYARAWTALAADDAPASGDGDHGEQGVAVLESSTAVDAPDSDVDPDAAAAWGTLMQELALQLQPATFDTWLRGARLLSYDAGGGEFVVGLPNAYARDWLENRLMGRIRRTLGGLLRRQVGVVFRVAPLGVGGAA